MFIYVWLFSKYGCYSLSSLSGRLGNWNPPVFKIFCALLWCFFFLFLPSCWMSSTNNLIWIFVTFVVIIEFVSFRFEPIFFLLTLSFAILVWDIIYVTALPQYNSVFISPLSDQHFDSHSSHKGDDQNAAKRRKANSANTVWRISKLR